MTEPSRVAIQLLDGKLKKHLQPLSVVLMYEDRFSQLPELCDVFGEDALIKFLDVFAGRTLMVPPRDVLERRFRAIRIWAMMSTNADRPQPDTQAMLALEYGLLPSQIAAIYRETREQLKALGIYART